MTEPTRQDTPAPVPISDAKKSATEEWQIQIGQWQITMSRKPKQE